eukprot:1322883-Amorphochlora_amoeboformis.AAC.2
MGSRSGGGPPTGSVGSDDTMACQESCVSDFLCSAARRALGEALTDREDLRVSCSALWVTLRLLLATLMAAEAAAVSAVFSRRRGFWLGTGTVSKKDDADATESVRTWRILQYNQCQMPHKSMRR